MRFGRKAAILAGVAVLAGAGLFLAQEPGDAALDKPLHQFTIGDLFPSLAGPIARQTGEVWSGAGTELRSRADGRQEAIDTALANLKQRIAALKGDVKAAQRSKDFTATGAAQGKLATEETVASILKRLDRVTDAQRDVGRAWHDAGEALLDFASAEDELDVYRGAGLEKPGADPNAPDTRLDAKGVDAFRSHAEAMDELGVAFTQLGTEIRSLVDDRLKFLAELERGGHVRTPPLK